MKVMIVGDVHWCKSASIVNMNGEKYTRRLENLIKSVNWVERTAENNNCKEIIYLGDFLDRPDLDSQEITALLDVRWAENIERRFLVGNHDASTIDLRFNSTNVLSHYGQIISNPCTVYLEGTEFVMVPYITSSDYIDLKPYYDKIDHKDKHKVLLAHRDLYNIDCGAFVTKSGFSLDDIDKYFDLFIDGHLHNHMEIGKKTHLIGNLTGISFNEDAAQYRHMIYILDTRTLEIQKIENPYALNFYKLEVSSPDELDKYDFNENSVVSITCPIDICTAVKDRVSQCITRVTVKYNDITDSECDRMVELQTMDPVKLYCDYAINYLGKRDNLNKSYLVEELNAIGGLGNEYTVQDSED